MENIKLNYSLYNSNPNLLVLLTLLSCALLVDVSVLKWIIMPPSIMVIFVLVCILSINYRLWWASVAIIILFLLVIGRHFPRLANHSNLEVFVCLAILIMYVKELLLKIRFTADTITQSFRYSLITIYFIAGFHKLNSGFFTVGGSCSSYVTQGLNVILFNQHLVYPDYVVWMLQVGTIVIEMIVPFGILYRKTRKLTAAVLIIFHFYLSFCGFSNFSVFATFLIAGSILDLKITPSPKLIKALRFFVMIAVISSLTVYIYRKFGWGGRQASLMINGVVLNIGIIYFSYYLLKEKNSEINNIRPFPLIFVFLICLWGIQGYVGLSNTSTLTMFSNLVTEKSRSNHFLINTAKTKIWNFEEDYLTIIELPVQEKKWEREYKIEDYDLPVIEFKKIANEWVRNNEDTLACTIRYRGEIIKINNLADSEFSQPKWWYRFLYFRRIPVEGVNQCMW